MKGQCLNRLTNGPDGSGSRIRTYDLPGMNRTLWPTELCRHNISICRYSCNAIRFYQQRSPLSSRSFCTAGVLNGLGLDLGSCSELALRWLPVGSVLVLRWLHVGSALYRMIRCSSAVTGKADDHAVRAAFWVLHNLHLQIIKTFSLPFFAHPEAW